MSGAKYRLRVKTAVPQLNLHEGDLITWDHGSAGQPFVVHRRCDLDMGTLLVALNEGRLDPIILTPADASSPPLPSVEEAAGRELPRLLLLHPQRRMG